MTAIRIVKVKRTIYTKFLTPTEIKDYIISCVATGSAADLFRNPKIPTAYYTAGSDAVQAILDAKTAYDASPTGGNFTTWENKGKDGIDWLNGYADKVEVIANSDTNRTSRAEAFANIQASYLTPQKLSSESKGKPDAPTFSATNKGLGKVRMEMTNGIDYNPSSVTFIAVEEDPDMVLTLTATGLLVITYGRAGSAVILTGSRKAKYTTMDGLNSGKFYTIYAYAQNGKKQISDLSAGVRVKA